jgi:hypothetical protein
VPPPPTLHPLDAVEQLLQNGPLGASGTAGWAMVLSPHRHSFTDWLQPVPVRPEICYPFHSRWGPFRINMWCFRTGSDSELFGVGTIHSAVNHPLTQLDRAHYTVRSPRSSDVSSCRYRSSSQLPFSVGGHGCVMIPITLLTAAAATAATTAAHSTTSPTASCRDLIYLPRTTCGITSVMILD